MSSSISQKTQERRRNRGQEPYRKHCQAILVVIMLYAFVDEFKTIRRLNLKVAYLNNLFNVIICCYKFFKVSLSFLKKLQTKMGANENHNYSLTYLYLQFQVALMCIYIQPNPVLLRLERQVKLNAVPLQKNTSFAMFIIMFITQRNYFVNSEISKTKPYI